MSQKRTHSQAFMPYAYPYYPFMWYPYNIPLRQTHIMPLRPPQQIHRNTQILDLTVLDRKEPECKENSQTSSEPNEKFIMQTDKNVKHFMLGLIEKNPHLQPIQTKYLQYDKDTTVTLFQFKHENQKLWMVQNTSFGSALCSGNKGNSWRVVQTLESDVDKFIVSCRIPIQCSQSNVPYEAVKKTTLISKRGIEKVCTLYCNHDKQFIAWTRKTIVPALTLTESI